MPISVPLNVDLPRFIRALRSLFQAEHVYLRELVQNSLEATHQAKLAGYSVPPIDIIADAASRTLTVTDGGIGMTREQIQSDLTKLFASGWPTHAGQTLGIGQFGFGFFSAFLVSSKVVVISRSLHAPERAVRWQLQADDQAPTVSVLRKLPPIGTSVTLHIDPVHEYILDDAAIAEELLNHYLYAHYQIRVGETLLSVAAPEDWGSRQASPTGGAETADWLVRRYQLNSPPIAIQPITIDNGGWLAVIDASDDAPPLEIFRRGIFVTSRELIPEPYNLFITGVVDMHEISVKPDRETLYRDANFERLVDSLRDASRQLTIHAVRTIRESGRNVFARHFHAATIALQRDKELRMQVGLDLPVPLYRADRRGRTSLPLREVIDDEAPRCIYWSEDRSADAIFADRLFHLDKIPVYLGDPGTHQLVLQICADHRVRAYELARSYSARIVRDRSHRATPYVENLFADELGRSWHVVSTHDVDARLPLRLVPGWSQFGDEASPSGGLAVLNTNSAAIRNFLDDVDNLDISAQLRFVSAACSLAKLLTEPDEIAHHLELANKHFLFSFTSDKPELPISVSTPASPWDILQARYQSLLAATRAFINAYHDEEEAPLWYLRDELRMHPRAADLLHLLRDNYDDLEVDPDVRRGLSADGSGAIFDDL